MYDLAAILDMPLSIGIDLIFHAIKKEKENATWEIWKSLYPLMVMKWIPFKSLDDFNKMTKEPKHSTKTEKEIFTEMIPIIKSHERR